MLQLPPTLSEESLELLNLNRSTAYTALVVRGQGNPQAKARLDGLLAATIFSSNVTKSPVSRSATLAAMWLWHDWLSPAHEIAQLIHTPIGSYWHAIMHRREGDFSNSKYWYAKAGKIPALSILGVQAGGVVNELPADRSLLRVTLHGFDPAAFVDFVEEVEADPSDPRYQAAIALQRLEWSIIFDAEAR